MNISNSFSTGRSAYQQPAYSVFSNNQTKQTTMTIQTAQTTSSSNGKDTEIGTKAQMIKSAVKSIESMTASDYTEDSWQALIDTASDAMSRANDKKATSAQLSAALNKLLAALAGLKRAQRDEAAGNPTQSMKLVHAAITSARQQVTQQQTVTVTGQTS